MNEQNLITAIKPELIISDCLLNPALKILDLYGEKIDEYNSILEIITEVSWQFENGNYVSSNLLETQAYQEEYTREIKERLQCLSEINYLFKVGMPGLEYGFLMEEDEVKITLNSGSLVMCKANKKELVLLDFVPQMEFIDNLKQQEDWYGVIRYCQLMLRTPDYQIPNEKKYLIHWNLGTVYCQINQHYIETVVHSNDNMVIRIGKTAKYYYYMHAMLNCLDALIEGDHFNQRDSLYHKTHREKIKQLFKKTPQLKLCLENGFFTDELDSLPLDKKWRCYEMVHNLFPSHPFIKDRFNRLKSLIKSLQSARDHRDKDYELSASYYLGIIQCFPGFKEEGYVNDNDLSQIYYELSTLQFSWGKYDEAEKNCHEASTLYERENEAPHVLKVLGDIDFKRGDYQKGYKRFQVLANVEELSEDLDKFRYVYAWYKQGIAKSHLNDHSEALRCYQEVICSFVDIGFRQKKPVYARMLYSLNCLGELDEEDIILKNKAVKKTLIYAVQSIGHLKKILEILGDDFTKLEDFYRGLMQKLTESSQLNCILFLCVTLTQKGFHWSEEVFLGLMETLIALNKKELSAIKEKECLFQFCHQVLMLKPINIVLCQKSIQLLWRFKPQEAMKGACKLIELYPEHEEVLLNLNDPNFYEQLGHEFREQEKLDKALNYYLKAIDGIAKKKQPALSVTIFTLIWQLGGDKKCDNLLSILQYGIEDYQSCQQLVSFLLEDVSINSLDRYPLYDLINLLSVSPNTFVSLEQCVQLIEKYKSMPNAKNVLINFSRKAKEISEYPSDKTMPTVSVEMHERLIKLLLDYNLPDLAVAHYLSVKNKPTDLVLHKTLVNQLFQWKEEGGMFVGLKKNPSSLFQKTLEFCTEEDLILACKTIILVGSWVRSDRKNLYLRFFKLIECHPYHVIIQPFIPVNKKHKKNLLIGIECYQVLLGQFAEIILEERKHEKINKISEFFVTAIGLYSNSLKKETISLIVDLLFPQMRNLFHFLKMLGEQGKNQEAEAIFKEIIARDKGLYEKFIDALPENIKLSFEEITTSNTTPDVHQEDSKLSSDQGVAPLSNLLNESKQEVRRLLETHSMEQTDLINPKVNDTIEEVSSPPSNEKKENFNVQIECNTIITNEKSPTFVESLSLKDFPENHPIRRMLEDNPYNINALIGLSHFLFINGRYSEALDYFDHIEYLSGTDETWMDFVDYHRAFILFTLKDYHRAIPYFENVQSNHQNCLLDYLGIAYFKVKNYEKAMACFKTTEALGLQQYSVDYYRGRTCLLLENYTGVIFYYGRMISYRPDDRLLNFLGTAYFKIGDYTNALECFDKAIQIFKKAIIISGNVKEEPCVLLYNKGMCYLRQEDYQEAELWFKTAFANHKFPCVYDMLDLAAGENPVKDQKVWELMPAGNQFRFLLCHYLSLCLLHQGHYQDALFYVNEAKILSEPPKVENVNTGEIYKQPNSNLFFGKEKESSGSKQNNMLVFQ